MSTGLFDWLGAEQNLTVLAGRAWERELEFVDTTDGGREAMDVSDVTFDGVVTAADGSEVGMEVSHREEENLLLVVFPALEAGVYRWEMRAVDDSGEKRRVMYGRLGVLATRLDLEREASDEVEALRMRALVPGKDARRIMAEWRATTKALLAAGEASAAADAAAKSAEKAEASKNAAADAAAEAEAARDGAKEVVKDAAAEAVDEAVDKAKETMSGYLDKAEEAADAAAKSAEKAKDEVNEAIGNVDEIRDRAKAAVEKAEAMEGRLDSIDEHLRQSVVPNENTGTWWIAGKDSGYPYQGEDGKSPYVNEDGEWMVWDVGLEEWVNTHLNAQGAPGRSPKVATNGNWLRWDEVNEVWEDTGVAAKGKDGRDGTSVRRILVDRVEDIPHEGETCNGGVYYYVPNVDDMPRAVIEPLADGRTDDDRLVIDGAAVELPGAGLAVEEAALALASNIEAGCSWLRAEVEGAKVKIYTVDEGRQTLTVNRSGAGYAVLEIPMEDREGYHVFAWLEELNGEAGWVRVGLANDVATKEVYGLTKLGTDMVVEKGSPVGVNDAGEMNIPHADYGTPGAMLPSATETLGSGCGEIGFDESGRARVTLAAWKKQGVVALSWAGEAEVGVIGRMADGTIGTMWATLTRGGVVKLGSEIDEHTKRPYLVGVGVTSDHALANNLLVGGALQHKTYAAWQIKEAEWLDPESGMVDWCYYLGLETSEQFVQSEVTGLELKSATGSLKAGVYVAQAMTDTRAEAVPNAALVKSWTLGTFYTKSEIDSKESELNKRIDSEVSTLNKRVDTEVSTLDKRIDSEVSTLDTRVTSEVKTLNTTINTKESALSKRIDANKDKFGEYTNTTGMKKYVADELMPYEKTNTLLGRDYATNKRVTDLDAQNIKCTDGVRKIYVMPPAEFEASRGKRDPKGLYIKATM